MSHYGDRGGGYGDRGGYGGGGDRYGGGGGDRYGSGGGASYGSSNLGAGLRDIKWDLSKLPVFEKNFYIEHPRVNARDENHAVEWRRQSEITIVGEGIPKPVLDFEEASMPEYVLKEVMKQGFSKRENISYNSHSTSKQFIPYYFFVLLASPIQSQGWPMALLGRDMIGISATGSGKTLAFLLPAMIHINAQVY